MPPALPSGPPEPMKEPIGNVRKALDALKAAVGRKNPLETPQKRHDRIKTSVEPLAVETQKFREAIKEYKDANQGFENTPEYQKLVEIDTALVGTDATPDTVEMADLIYGITDDEWFVNEANPYLKDLTAEHMADEIALLQSTLTVYDRAVDGVTKFYDKLPQGFRDKLEELGIGTMTAVGIIMGMLAQYVDLGPGPFRNFAKTLRAGSAIRQASSEGMSQTAITEGRKKWELKYAAWMQETTINRNAGGPMPDLYELIQQEEVNAAAERKFNEQKGRFDAYIVAVPPPSLFGDVGGTEVRMELTRGAAPKVVKVGANWKAVLSENDIDENTAAGTFTLKAEADKLKSLFHIAVAADPNLSEVKNGAFALQEGGILSAEINAEMTQPRLETALLKLKPNGAGFKTLKLYDNQAKRIENKELAKRTAQVLEVNYKTLDDPAKCAKLKTKADGNDPDGEWHYNSAAGTDNWVV